MIISTIWASVTADDAADDTAEELLAGDATSKKLPISGSFARQRRTASTALEIHELIVSQNPADAAGAADDRELDPADAADADADDAAGACDAGGTRDDAADVEDTDILIN